MAKRFSVLSNPRAEMSLVRSNPPIEATSRSATFERMKASSVEAWLRDDRRSG